VVEVEGASLSAVEVGLLKALEVEVAKRYLDCRNY